jgi:predicted enzyme related to lactoylglutathione lyase
MPIPGEPVWLELQTTDLEKAHAFYGALLGWEFADSGADFGHYNMVSKDGKIVAGAMAIDPAMMAGVPDNFSVYLSVADPDATAEAVTRAGGHVLLAPMKVGESGAMAFFADATGAPVGAWRGDDMDGIQAMTKPGTPCWFELMTNNYDAAVAFYKEAFGWDAHPMGPQGGEWQYTTLGEGAGAKAGICDARAFIPPEGQSFWRSYLGVEDCDSAVETLKSLGGRLLDGPADSPFGRVATVTDDQGAMFQMLQELPRSAG